jgi:polysaccharide pyruvyl transferase WcaK-like protein
VPVPTLHHVFANRSNVGDWLSAIGIQSLLPGVPVVEHLCDEPFVPETLAALERARPGDAVVIGGGGLFMDYFEPFWRGFLPLAGRLPFAVWGVGFVDLKLEPSRASTDLLADVLRRARVVRVRDELTRSLLGAVPLPPPVPCPSHVAVPRRPPAGRALLHVDNLTTVGEDVYESMLAQGRAFAERTGRRFLETNNLIPKDDRAALARVLDLYGASDLVLTSRLHGAILAHSTGRRFLAVSGDRKVESYLQAAGLSSWGLDLAEAGSVGARLAELERAALPAAAEELLARARRENEAVAREVRALLAGGAA